MPEISNFSRFEIFFEFFENYIKDFPKIDQNTILKKTEIIIEIYYVFFGYIAESNWRGN